MTKRTSSTEAITLLVAFWHLARANRDADLGTLAGRLGWGAGRVVRVLAHLDHKGLADRGRCRLTLTGLAVATSLAAEGARVDRAVRAAAVSAA